VASLEKHRKFQIFLEMVREEKWTPEELAEVIKDETTREQYEALELEIKGYNDDEDTE